MSGESTGGLQSRRRGRCGRRAFLDLSNDTRDGKGRSMTRTMALRIRAQIEFEALTVESHGWASKGTKREVKVKPSKMWDALKMENRC